MDFICIYKLIVSDLVITITAIMGLVVILTSIMNYISKLKRY